MEKEMAVRLQDLTKCFGEETVLKNINQEFEAGRVHGIVGMNGSGKTVLLKLICGFLKPTKGSVFVLGKQVGRDVDFPDSLGMMIETPGFLPHLSGLGNLKMLASLKKRITEKEVRDSMRRVGLDPDSKKKVSKYSLGMRERLGIAQAIMERPELLILDEPFTGLDKNGVREVYGIIQEMEREQRTIFLVSHNVADIDTLCDTVCEMDAGKMTRIR